MGRLQTVLMAAAILLFRGAPLLSQDIECDPGDREVRGLDFRGNRAFSDGELALRIVTTPSSWARRHLRVFGTRRCLDTEELLRDEYRLRLLYRNAGYYDAKIDTVVAPAGRDQVRVAFVIDEGQPIRITTLSITGLDSVPNRREIARHLWVAVGKPFDATRIAIDADSIRGRLRNSGYPQPDVLRNWQTFTDSLAAHVAIEVLPGPRARISTISVDVTPVEGHQQEISERVVKKLVGVNPGDYYNEQALVSAQRNLYTTGAYRYVEVLPVEDSARMLVDSTLALKVTLLEDYRRDLNGEFGWATLDCFRTRAQIVDKDFLGGAQRLELTGTLSKIMYGAMQTNWTKQNLCLNNTLKEDPFSTRAQYSINATLRQPTLFGTWATPSFSFYHERRGEYKAYLRTTYIGSEVSLFRALRDNTSLRLGYNLELGKTEADQSLLCAAFSRCDPESISQITRPLRLAILSGTVARVRTDNPLDPRSGYVVRAESRNSATFLGSDPAVTFTKGVGDIAWYHGLGWGSVFAVRVRAGSIWGGAKAGSAKQPPQQERLYAGGASSVRGFQQNELGSLLYVFDSVRIRKVDLPRAANGDSLAYFVIAADRSRRVVPVGGNTLAVANVDYRLRSPFLSELLQFTLFTDVGSVWNRNTQTNFGGFRPYWTPGVGVRVFTPVGPIQVNAGYNPYPPVFGQALYTPPLSQAQFGLTGVYCAIPAVTPVSDALIAHRTVDATTGAVRWEQDLSSCPQAFHPPVQKGLRRLTFTFSIGPDF